LLQEISQGHWGRLLVGTILTLLVSALALPLAWIIRQAFDTWIPQGDTDSLVLGGFALFGLRAAHALLTVITRYINVESTEKMTLSLRTMLINRMFKVTKREYDNAKAGGLHNLVITESERFYRLVNYLVGMVFPAAVKIVALTLILAYLSWRLLLILIVVWPMVWLINEWVRRRAMAKVKIRNATFKDFSGAVLEKIRLLNLIRFEHQEESETTDTQGHSWKTAEASKPVAVLDTLYLEFQGVVLTLISVAVLTAGGREVANNMMTLGDFISFYMVVSLLNQALRDLAQGLYHVFVGWESLDEVVGWLNDADREVYTGNDKIQLAESLSLNSVNFSYREGQNLLTDMNLQLKRGDTVVLLGPNGSGKSTILWLLLGFYKPTSGQLAADGKNYDELDIGHLRAQIGMASQDALLLDASVRENVRYSHQDATDEEILRALELSGSAALLAQLKDGLDSLVGPNGALLSGGQRQRISLARALVKQPTFLFLDEPTNHLDESSVVQFLKNLESLETRPGILIITHDNALRAVADSVYEIRDGGLKLVQAEQTT
ncbi:MAG: ABC transporter ATP-binding protein, partial [Candidatus Eremiobacteraeota bacterium]|nr:ABC transporter ATP-binding protein [Candidatus Eremiobacteraeota bacterium]